MSKSYRVNTSNPHKLQEYRELLGGEVVASTLDLQEPDADPLTIIRYKASQFEEVIVEDVSLDVEGATLGTHIKWLVKELRQLAGRSAVFRCWLGVQRAGQIYLYLGEVPGEIVLSQGPEDFGFNSFFRADGDDFTLAQRKTAHNNARARAVAKFLAGQVDQVLEPLKQWDGPFQKG